MAKDDEIPENLNYIDSSLFESPVTRIGVSGGTAPFFNLKVANPEEGKRKTGYIGKDLSRATDELGFYEDAKDNPQAQKALGGLKDFLFSYLGILKTKEEGGTGELDLLVLQNLYDGKKKLRLVDIKIGETTASANWKGKSKFRAFKQKGFDKITNSKKEGYRLEGFEGSPPPLNSLETFMEAMSADKSSKACKQSRRLLYQGLTGEQIIQHLFDLHVDGLEESEELYTQDEYLEIIMHETVRLISKLAAECFKPRVPQKWIGSSLALGFDCGELPPRSSSQDEIRESVIVKVFDWGRSELNTSPKMKTFTPNELSNRMKYWEQYKNAIGTLAWITTNVYFGRFCCKKWSTVTLTIYDFDALSDDDFMCQAVVLVKDTKRISIPLHRKNGKDGGSIEYSMEYRESSQSSSRVAGSWKISIYEAKGLPNEDFSLMVKGADGGLSDPYVVVTAQSDDRKHSFGQHTTMIVDNLSPTWNETLSLPVAASSDACSTALNEAGIDCRKGETSERLEDWMKRLTLSAM